MGSTACPPNERRQDRDFDEIWAVEFARSDQDFVESLHLLQKRYEERGYVKKKDGAESADLTLFHILPNTRTILVRALERVLATVTFIPDSPLGLPADEGFRPEIDHLRAAGRRLAELSSLAVDDQIRLEDRPNLSRWLFHAMEALAFSRGRIDDVVITVNPRHVSFYERRIGFEPMTAPRPLAKVQGADAVLMRARTELDRSHLRWWEEAKKESAELMETLLENDPGWCWNDSRLSAWAEATGIGFGRVTDTGCRYIRSLFPTFQWSAKCRAALLAA